MNFNLEKAHDSCRNRRMVALLNPNTLDVGSSGLPYLSPIQAGRDHVQISFLADCMPSSWWQSHSAVFLNVAVSIRVLACVMSRLRASCKGYPYLRQRQFYMSFAHQRFLIICKKIPRILGWEDLLCYRWSMNGLQLMLPLKPSCHGYGMLRMC